MIQVTSADLQAHARPVVFGEEMVRKILSGKKTQTRRLVNLTRATGTPKPTAPDEVLDLVYPGSRSHYGHVTEPYQKPSWVVQRLCSEKCQPSPPGVYPPTGHADWRERGSDAGPYDGRHPVAWGPLPFWPGLRLWVKETWCVASSWYPAAPYAWKADYEPRDWKDHVHHHLETRSFDCMACGFPGWRSSRFMPRAATRLTLEVTGMRPERLHAISESDARSEGITFPEVPTICHCRTRVENPGPHVATCPWRDLDIDPMPGRPFASEYAVLWNRLHRKKVPWPVNPWVWVVDFRRVS